jgi:hypothetical protein
MGEIILGNGDDLCNEENGKGDSPRGGEKGPKWHRGKAHRQTAKEKTEEDKDRTQLPSPTDSDCGRETRRRDGKGKEWSF